MFDPPNSLRLRPTGLLAPFSVIPERTIDWARVSRIDTPNGRDVLRGAAGEWALRSGSLSCTGLGSTLKGARRRTVAEAYGNARCVTSWSPLPSAPWWGSFYAMEARLLIIG